MSLLKKRKLLISLSIIILVSIIFVGITNAQEFRRDKKESKPKPTTEKALKTEKPTEKIKDINITADDNGDTIKIVKNQKLVLSLESNLTTGYKWNYIKKPNKNILKQVNYEYIVPETDSVMVGVGGDEVWTYEGIEIGKTSIELAYMRFQDEDSVLDEFNINIEVVDESEIENDDVSVENSIDIDGTKVEVNLSITNNKEKEITITHTSSMTADFQLLDENKESLFTWSANKLFMTAITKTVIKPGDTKELICSDLIDEEITERSKYVKSIITGTSSDFEINEDGYILELK